MGVGEIFQFIALICGVVVGLIVLILFGALAVIDYMEKKRTIRRIKGRGRNIKIICDDAETTSVRLE